MAGAGAGAGSGGGSGGGGRRQDQLLQRGQGHVLINVLEDHFLHQFDEGKSEPAPKMNRARSNDKYFASAQWCSIADLHR
jgi:hypothetical protein